MNKLVIFDMDGTLVDTASNLTQSINYVRKVKALPPLEREEVINIIYSNNSSEVLKKVFNTDEFLQGDKILFEKHYKEQCKKNIALFPEIKKMLEILKYEDVKLAVATNSPTDFSFLILDTAKIKEYFELIIGSCKVKERKPNPEMFTVIEKYFKEKHVEITEKYVVGDHFTDIKAAKLFGSKSIFVTWGYGGYNEDSKPDFIIESPLELHRIILKNDEK